MEFARTAPSWLTPFVLASVVGLTTASPAEQTPQRPPVIDAHTHLDVKTGPSVMQSLNVRYWVLTLHSSDLRNWARPRVISRVGHNRDGLACSSASAILASIPIRTLVGMSTPWARLPRG